MMMGDVEGMEDGSCAAEACSHLVQQMVVGCMLMKLEELHGGDG